MLDLSIAKQSVWRIVSGTVDRRLSVACFALAAIAALIWLSGADPVFAGPTACTSPAPNTTLCVDNQHDGINVTSGTTLNVNNLSSDIAPANGVRGVSFTNVLGKAPDGDNGNASLDLTTTVNDSHLITTHGAEGIFSHSKGEDGGDGCHPCSVTVPDKTSKIGEAGGSVTITTSAPVTTDSKAAVFGWSEGGAGGNGSTGQDGSNGGISKGVTITVQNAIHTTGGSSPGIAALSKAGNGGNGDSNVSGSHGGQGLGAGDVTINTTATGSVETQNDNSVGILAQSIGGAGGTAPGGFTFDKAQPGGGAGSGGIVTVNTLANVTTHGNNSIAILAQSVGGGGGAGGFTSTGFTTSGGNGGSAGPGRDVNITTGAGTTLSTEGVQSSVIYAQSVGGGGGAGSGSFGLFLSNAGDGGAGGEGGNVLVTNNATLKATKDQSSGIYAQSVGGGGGSGGASGGLVSFGGIGGGGNNAGTVKVDNHGDITVLGNGRFDNNTTSTLSAGIFAQSVGGGGGDGGYSGGLVSFGGSGGAAGAGRRVEVDNTGKIDALCGNGCVGGTTIFAQSVGGGGGNGGISGGIAAFGGSGAGGGEGGDVLVNNSGSELHATAQNSFGIFAQSVGGGGGNGAFAGAIVAFGGSAGTGSKGGTVTVNNVGKITTEGNDSAGIFAQSVGGGGGNGGGSVGVGVFASFAMGGQGGAGGNGGIVCVNSNGTGCLAGPIAGTSDIKTTGERSSGIFAQSVGGGGGNGGFAVSASAGLFGDVSFGFGGKGDQGGLGNNVFVGGSGTITTGTAGVNPTGPGGTGAFSNGIDAQSIGGGGGNGGFSVAVAASTAAGFSLSMGGAGGSGNTGGIVTVNTQETIVTYGDQANGIVARSVGGGGGSGGFSVGASGSPFASLALVFGGAAGDGGAGQGVSVDNVGSITTNGQMANGITAQSVGGGGGNGGFAVSGAFTVEGGAANMSFGGKGGSGAAGGTVHVMNTGGNITTYGEGSIGVLAQSIGGGGGNGGFAGGIGLSGGAAYSSTIGGAGGGANKNKDNNASKVDVTIVGDVTTLGNNAAGIQAQSIGGGGGNGGFSISAAGALDSFAIGNSKGGRGGTGSTGGEVDVETTGLIKTGTANSGSLSYGIFAQSIGGGGGSGGFAISAALSESGSAGGNTVGGAGGEGNNGGIVNVTTHQGASSSDVIQTLGLGATGILAQSIGGGGGNGGFAIKADVSISGGAGGNGNLLGGGGDKTDHAGPGGGGSNGMAVTVKNNGGISTSAADGIVAQSIGGGGGNGGFAITLAFSSDGNTTSNAMGGTGGYGGVGGGVQVFNKGDIRVRGDGYSGIVAQSIGGGGGNGGFSIAGGVTLNGDAATNAIGGAGGGGGGASEVDVENSNAITVGGKHASGIIAQSIGGGGGNGGFSIGVGVSISGSKDSKDSVGGSGGNGGSGGGAGIVKVTTFAGSSITTNEAMDNGIVAQSIGGGGGNGGFSIAGAFTTSGKATTSIGGSCSDDCKNNGAGGGGGDANTVTVDNAGNITTTKANSIGILAQSIGGGGGNGGFVITADFSSGGSAATNSVGGTGGDGGKGQAVNVFIRDPARIDIQANNSTGILAQSVGGGGGSGGFSIGASGTASSSATASNSLGGAGGGGGNGGDVVVTTSSNSQILTKGMLDNGIVAQSIGGGGGNGGFSVAGNFSTSGDSKSTIGGSGAAGGGGGMGLTVTVDNAGLVQTDGVRSTGITAQSIGGGGGNGGFTAAASISINGGAATNAVGGSGGKGGAASLVKVTQESSATVNVKQSDSIGILAQSIGGGGGSGGFSIGASGAIGNSDSASNNLGGSGGLGGTAGEVIVKTIAGSQVVTQGTNDQGIIAQSIGGGGGNAGFTISGTFSIGGKASSNVGGSCDAGCAAPVNSTGAGGGDAMKVTVDNAGLVQTNGLNSVGITAQSIGGGGGNGGFSVAGGFSVNGAAASNSIGGSGGAGGVGGMVEVTLESTSYVNIQKGGSIGVLAQSIGGGGGNGGFSVAAAGSAGSNGATNSIGGSGGTGGASNTVSVTALQGSRVFTAGDNDFGIVAQSIGGGGGNGGFLFSGTFTLSGDAKSTIGGGCAAPPCARPSGGGQGGGGGTSEQVTVDNAGQVVTTGASSIGIVAQSIGGGGGNGGMTGSLSVASNSATTNAVGGSGGKGGDGGVVVVTNRASGLVHTEQANSIGILAQSIGGGGGNGGFSIGLGASTSGGATATSVGGSGGDGGSAKDVTVTNNGRIETMGQQSAGIVAQSIGGGGGNGGFSVAGSLGLNSGGMNNSAGGSDGGGGGGNGGGGGDGKKVMVTNTGTIVVTGNNSVGIVAQSVGGGGGSAGFSGSANFGNGGMINNKVGATGGDGGNGGDVQVTSTGTIMTGGNNSIAVLAQSIGGGGGNGALSFGLSSDGSLSGTDLRVGGMSSGTGGSMGTVTVDISGGTTITTGALAYGMLAQAIGGGGGNGGLVFAKAVKIGADPTIMVGGTGGMLADGTVMNATNANVVNTTGAGAAAQVVQSIGGGGGTNAMTGDINGGNIPFNLYIGGNQSSGALGGSGNTVNYVNSGSLTTSGDSAIGALVQSIGGGGGYGDYALGSVTGNGNTFTATVGGSQKLAGSGNGQAVNVLTFTAPVHTTGLLAEGLIAQSIGGGGGVGNFVAASGINLAAGGLQMTAGGLGGLGGNASTVTVTPTAPITTTNTGSLGVIVQSIGGGGGVAQAYGVSGTGSMTIGAANGSIGDGGIVDLTLSQLVQTQGIGAHAILAQSIGGGGGFIQAYSADGTPITTPIQAGVGGGGGSGKAVDVTTSGAVMTSGNGAFGIIAQSIGGGGGLVGGSGAFANNLPTNGAFAGSAGGLGFAGAVTIGAQSNVVAMGQGSTAVYAQSANAAGIGGNIGITLGNASLGTNQFVVGGAGGAATTNAVTFAGGAANTLTSYAYLTTMSGINGTTITGGIGNEAVNNFGHMIGSIDLGSGTNTINNKPYNNNPSLYAGVFDSGSNINLGGPAIGNVMTNDGLLSPGAFLKVMTTGLNGNFVQTASGSCGTFGQPTSTCGYFGIDVNFANATADRLNVTGTASVSGAVVVNIGNAGDATPGTSIVTIISAAQGETHPNLALQAYQTAVATYSLLYPNATDIDLKYSIDFSPAGLSQNGHAVGDAINAIQTAHVAAFKPVAAAIFYQPTVEQLGAVYNSLSGEGVAAVEQTAIAANDIFHTSILNEARFWLFDNERSDINSVSFYDAPLGYTAARGNTFPSYAKDTKTVAVTPRTWRLWTNFNGGDWRYAGNANNGSANTAAGGGGFTSGLDYQVNSNLMAGIAVGYGKAWIKIPDRATTASVEGTHVAAYTAAKGPNAYAIASLGFDYFTNSENRSAAIPGTVLPPLFGTQIPPVPGFSERLTGNFNSYSVSGLFETGYKYRFESFNVTPLAGVNFTSLWMNGFTESNTGAPSVIGLSFASRNINSIPAYLGAQLDSKQDLANGGSLYGWIRAAWVHEFLPHRTVNPSFISAPGFGFVIEGAQAPNDLARISAGGKVGLNQNVSVSLDVRADIYRTPSYSGWTGVHVAW